MCIYVLCMYVNIYVCIQIHTFICVYLYICFTLICCNHKWKNWIPELYCSMTGNIAPILISHCPLALAAERFPQPRTYLVSLASTHPFTWPFAILTEIFLWSYFLLWNEHFAVFVILCIRQAVFPGIVVCCVYQTTLPWNNWIKQRIF